MPLVGEALRATPGEVVAEGDLTSAIRELFGLDLPQAAVKALLRRARKADLVSLENRMYHPKRENLEGSRFGEKQAYVLECHARLLDNIASFSREHFQVEISSQQADAALQAFIRDNEFTLISGLPMPSPIPVNGPLNARERFLIASYISYVQEKQTPDLAYLEMVVKGAILSGALYLEVPGQAARNFVDTDVYVDTRSSRSNYCFRRAECGSGTDERRGSTSSNKNRWARPT